MKEIKSVLISGLGAVGSVYASMLYDIDPQMVAATCDQERMARYIDNGIYINDKPYPITLHEPEGVFMPFDLIIVAVKQHHLQNAIMQMKRFVGPDTLILSLLNGIISEEMLAEAYGFEKVVHGFCIGTDATRDCTNTRYTNTGKIIFGVPKKMKTSTSEATDRIASLFDRAGIPNHVPEDILREQWWKFMMNVGINQVSAILRATYGVFQHSEEARDLMRSACREVVLLAESEKIHLTFEDIESYFPIINRLSSQSKTSMLQDIEAGRKTEVALFGDTVIALGKKHGIPTPINEVLSRMIKVLESYPNSQAN